MIVAMAARVTTNLQLFRELIATYLARVSTLTGREWRADPFFQVGRRPGRSRSASVGKNHDRHLYRARH